MTEVAAIVADVRERGDAALADWSERLDGVEPARAVPEGDVAEDALLALAASVRRWHQLQRPADLRDEIAPGVVLERRWVPLASVGIYVPRRLVSTLVMCAVPALVAGVERIVVATPPVGAGVVARAAELLGLKEVWALGGPQAIAALAYGTERIAAVDKIVGPGNAFVSEAKAIVSQDVSVDLPAGPSEVVVLASEAPTCRSRSSSSPPSGSTAPTRCAASWRRTATSKAPSSASRSLRPSTSCSWGRRPSGSRRASATPGPCSSARGRPWPPATTPPVGTTSSPRAAVLELSEASVWRPS